MLEETEVEVLPEALPELADLSTQLWEEYFEKRNTLGRAQKGQMINRYNQVVEKYNDMVGWKSLMRIY